MLGFHFSNVSYFSSVNSRSRLGHNFVGYHVNKMGLGPICVAEDSSRRVWVKSGLQKIAARIVKGFTSGLDGQMRNGLNGFSKTPRW